MEKLGCMKRIDDLRSIWPHEEQDFSKWLAQKENLEQLSDAIEIDLELEETESPVGSFSVDMRDGSILALGKGNAEWNYSAPHGAGRIMSRTQAIKELSLKEYQQEMAGVYTTSVNEGTIDEAPMAYKSLDDILDVIGDTVDVIDVMKPVYNFKAAEEKHF